MRGLTFVSRPFSEKKKKLKIFGDPSQIIHPGKSYRAGRDGGKIFLGKCNRGEKNGIIRLNFTIWVSGSWTRVAFTSPEGRQLGLVRRERRPPPVGPGGRSRHFFRSFAPLRRFRGGAKLGRYATNPNTHITAVAVAVAAAAAADTSRGTPGRSARGSSCILIRPTTYRADVTRIPPAAGDRSRARSSVTNRHRVVVSRYYYY